MPETQELPLELVADFYSAYLRNYIERDARSFSLPQDVQTFWSFVRLLASLNAQEIVPAALAREWGVVAPTVACWLETLRATFQYQSIPAFSGNPVKRVTGKAKGLLREVGLGVHLLSLAGWPGLGGRFAFERAPFRKHGCRGNPESHLDDGHSTPLEPLAELRSSETLILAQRDRDLFWSLLENPPEPNEALRSLFAKDCVTPLP
jgi:hypothetical protein